MSNEVSTSVFGGAIDVKDMAALAAKAKSAGDNNPRGSAPNGSDYMNFSGKQGRYFIGQGDNRREIGTDEIWVVDVTSFEEGWVCWKGGKSPSSRMANIYKNAPISQPEPDELGPFDAAKGDGWFQAKAWVMRSTEDDGQQGYLKINSISGVSAMAELMGEFSERAQQGVACWPALVLKTEQFESQGYKNFKPVFEVVAWLDNKHIEALADGHHIDDIIEEIEDAESEPAPVDEPTPEPKKGRGRARK